MFLRDESFADTILGTLFFALFYWISYQKGREDMKREIKENKNDKIIADLQRKLAELNRKHAKQKISS